MKEQGLIVERIIDALPPLGGVVPANNSPRKISNILINKRPEQGPEQVAEAIEIIKEAAREVGLGLTVNDLARLVKFIANNLIQGLIIPPIYKGVSFNPSGGAFKEWLFLLDFFALMKKLNERVDGGIWSKTPMAILDASWYWVVNLMGDKLAPQSRDPLVAAREMVEQIRERVDNERGGEVWQRALERNAFCRAIAQQFPTQFVPPVFTVDDVWQDEGFFSFLAEALRIFCVYEQDKWVVKRAVRYERYMPYSTWVTPLVAAEQTFLGKRLGFQAFLSPVEEAAWVKPIDLMCRKVRVPLYVFLSYQRRKFSYDQVPSFADSQDEIFIKLQAGLSRELPQIIAQLVAPFVSVEKQRILLTDKVDLVKMSQVVSGFTSQTRAQAEQFMSGGDFLPTPLSKIGWLMVFPPGTC